MYSPVEASCTSVRQARPGSRRRSLEVLAVLSRSSIFHPRGRVVVSELALRFVCEPPEKADVGVGHDRARGWCPGIEMATAWGSSMGRSSGPRRRKPRTLRLAMCSGGSPHSGQAAMYAEAAGVKRS